MEGLGGDVLVILGFLDPFEFLSPTVYQLLKNPCRILLVL